jgi:hypothetical protein
MPAAESAVPQSSSVPSDSPSRAGDGGPVARRRELLVAAALVVIAAIPRLVALRHSLWFDELWSVDKFMRHGPLYALTHHEGYNNHLLNSALGSVALWLHSFASPPPDPLALPPAWVVRLPAFLFGLAAVPMLYVAARPRAGRAVAALAALLLALSPFAVDFSAQARGYSALLFFTIAQTPLLASSLETGRARPLVAWVVCASLATVAHLYFVGVVAVDLLFVALVAVERRRRRDPSRSARRLMVSWAAAAVAWAALSALAHLGVWDSFPEEAHRYAGKEPLARAHEVLLPLLQLFGGVPSGAANVLFLAASGALALGGLAWLVRSAPRAATYLALLLVVPPALVELGRPYFVYMRFFTFLLPPFLLLVAVGCVQFARALVGGRPARAAIRGVVAVAAAACFVGPTIPGLVEVMRVPKQDLDGVTRLLVEETRRGHAVVATGLGGKYLRLSDYRRAAWTDGELPERQRRIEAELEAMGGGRQRSSTTVAQLRALWKEQGELVVVDSGLTNSAEPKPSPLLDFVRAKAGASIATFPGRHAGWPQRWLDGDSDLQVYRLKAGGAR